MFIKMISKKVLNFSIKNYLIVFSKFVRVGVFITILSLILSYLFLKIIGTPLIITYVALYILMIFLSFTLNTKYTFKSKRNASNLLLYYTSYVISMLIGIVLLSVFRYLTNLENWMLAYMVLPFTMTSNFILSSLLLKKDANK